MIETLYVSDRILVVWIDRLTYDWGTNYLENIKNWGTNYLENIKKCDSEDIF